MNEWLADQPSDWVKEWLTACRLTEWKNDWLTVWPTNWMSERMIGWLTYCQTGWLTEWKMTGGQPDWFINKPTDWLIDWLTDNCFAIFRFAASSLSHSTGNPFLRNFKTTSRRIMLIWSKMIIVSRYVSNSAVSYQSKVTAWRTALTRCVRGCLFVA